MSDRSQRPPRLAERILEFCLPPRERQEVLGDMAEGYRRRAARSSVLGAKLWYWRHAVETPARLASARVRTGVSLSEVRYAVRSLTHSPGFTAVAVLSLGLGIGANTAIYSSMRALLYTELPLDRPEELAFIYHERPERNSIWQFSSGQTTDPTTGADVHSNMSFPGYEALREVAGAEVEVAGFAFIGDLSLAVDDLPAAAGAGQMVSGNYFSTLGVPMHLGRPIGLGDTNLGARNEAVLSHAFWQRIFSGDDAVLNRQVRINGQPFTVVGVTAPDFIGLSPGGFFAPTDLTVAFATHDTLAPMWARQEGSLLASSKMYWVRPIARLRPGLWTEPLREAMTVALRAEMLGGEVVEPDAVESAHVRFLPAGRGLDSLRAGTEGPLRILAYVVGFVLMIACMNIANLMLARGAARQHEIAVRRALGAGRFRLIRQGFLESLFIALAGGAAGLAIAAVGGPAITVALGSRLGSVGVGPTLDLGMLAIAGGVSLLAAVLFGVLPAVRLSRVDVSEHLAGRGAAGGGRSRVGRALIAIQIAVSIPLIVGAGLFLQTLGNLGQVDLGFQIEDLVMFRLDPELVTDDVDRAHEIIRRVVADVGELPGVQSATVLGNALLSGWVSNGSVTIDEERAQMYWNAVGEGTFETLGVPLRSGRPIRDTDDAASPPVIVVNETAERTLFDGRALGRTIRWGVSEWEVVGVVADTRYRNVRSDVPPTFFHSFQQSSRFAVHLMVRTKLTLGQLGPAIQATVAAVDSGLPVTGLRTQQQQVRAALGREMMFAQLLAGFSAFALLIACIGLYGVTSYAVTRRRPELGVRIALGARSPQIIRLVVGQVLALTSIGVVVGVFGAYLLGPVVESMLYGVEAGDTMMLVAASLVMVATAVAAAWFPALRAARTDALEVLSSD